MEFVRRELAPTPGRWQAALRITLACIACTVPIMAFHLKEPLIVMIGMFLVAAEDTTTTMLGSILGMVGLTIGCGLLLLYYVCVVDLIWLRVLCVPVFITLGLFLNRTVTIGPMGSAIGIPLALGMIVPDVISSSEYLTRFPFYIWWALSLGLIVNLAVQYLMNPQTSQSLLIRGLCARLDAVGAMLRRLAAGEEIEAQRSALSLLALEGVINQLHLLKLAGMAEPLLKKRRAEMRAQFIIIDRLVTAAAVLDIQEVSFPDEPMRRRLHCMAEACARWCMAIKEGRQPEIPEPNEGGPAAAGQIARPSLAEMERAADLMPFTFPSRELPAELKPAPVKDKGGIFVSDAFTNPDYIRSAIKGALAGFICYVIFTMASYQGVYTSVVTCIVCSLSTVGAGLQKGVLRFVGAAVGGVLGLIALVYIFPHIDSLGGFWFPFGAVTGLAAYVNRGSPRIAYCGYQISLAFDKCVLQSYGPYTELRVIRDRLVGIVLGLTVFALIDNLLWPVKAMDATRKKLSSVLRDIAKLAGLPDEDDVLQHRLTEAYGLRLQAYQDFGAVRQLFESSKFESGAAIRKRLEEINATAQMLFLHLLAIIQHRTDLRSLAVPEPIRMASAQFRTAVANVILNLSDRVEGKPEHQLPDLQSSLAELEQTVNTQIHTISDASLVTEIRARLALYQETAPIALKLVELQTG